MALQVALIVNPRAGGGRGTRVAQAALPVLRRHGLQPDVQVCADGTEPTRRARQAVMDGARLVIAVGGDGHAAAVGEGILGTASRLAVLPTGSANDLARALGMPIGDPPAAARIIADGRPALIDVVQVETPDGVRHFLNVGGTGFDAAVARRAQGIRYLRGAARYVVAVLRELPTYAAASVRLEVDGTIHDVEAMMIAVANGTTYGGGMRVAPGARLASGVLEVCLVHRLSKAAFVRAFPLVFAGRHVSHPKVTMMSGREICISAERELELTGDGELIGRLPARFRVLPGALEVIAGPGASLA